MINNNLSRARISTAASGNTTIVSGATGKTIRVYRLALGAASAVDAAIMMSAASGLTELQKFRQLGSLVMEDGDYPLYVTDAASSLVINLSSAVAVDGAVWYVQE